MRRCFFRSPAVSPDVVRSPADSSSGFGLRIVPVIVFQHLLNVALAIICIAATTYADDPLAVEAKRRNDELVKQGFNLTYGVPPTR